MIKSRAKALAIGAMAHQKVSLAHDSKTPHVFDMSDPGTGKTAVRVWAFAARRRKRGGCLLVVAPRSLLRVAWGNDFARFAPDMVVSIATASNREKALDADADVYIVNHDAVKVLVKKPKTWFAKFSELTVDESTAFKHHTNQRSRALSKIAHMVRSPSKPLFERKSALSATPTSNGVCDIWHQVHVLDGGARLGPNFFGFRSAVCIPKQVGQNKNAVNWSDKPGAEEAVYGLLSEIVVRHKFEDCVDIPPTHTYTVAYDLEPKQRKAYDEMHQEQILQLTAANVLHKLMTGIKPTHAPGLLPGVATPSIMAINGAAVATKLLQIASGAVYDAAGKYHIIDRGRYETLIEMASQRKHPLMMFFWQHQRDLLVEEAEKAGMTFCVFDGNTNDFERNKMVQDYQAGKFDLMLGHPQTVAHGLTLTRGTSVIWPGPTYNLEWWLQANKRQARIGQKEKTEVVTLVAPNTIEEKVYAMCMGKEGRMDNLLELFESVYLPVNAKVARKLVAE